MITTVCLNPAIDKSATVDHMQLLEVNRLRDIRTAIGGKGINVAVVLKRLQADVCCVGFMGEADERFFMRGFSCEQLCFRAVLVPGNVRSNLKIIDADTLAVTEFNEQGAQVTPAALEDLTKELYSTAEASSYIALCGSLPPGCGADTYRKLMQTLPGKHWVVDATGEALRQALEMKPFLIKPNLAELEELVQERLTTRDIIQAAAIKLCRAGTSHVAVSMGSDGALLTDGTKTVFAPALTVLAKSTVGAGDAMLAGMLYGLDRGETVFESLRYGIAAGAACVQGGGAHAFHPEEFQRLLEHVTVTEI